MTPIRVITINKVIHMHERVTPKLYQYIYYHNNCVCAHLVPASLHTPLPPLSLTICHYLCSNLYQTKRSNQQLYYTRSRNACLVGRIFKAGTCNFIFAALNAISTSENSKIKIHQLTWTVNSWRSIDVIFVWQFYSV